MKVAMKIMRSAQIFRTWMLALGLLTTAGAQSAGPWYVATNGADSNAGTSWSVPFLTINNAPTNAMLCKNVVELEKRQEYKCP